MVQKIPEQLEIVDVDARATPRGKILKHELREQYSA